MNRRVDSKRQRTNGYELITKNYSSKIEIRINELDKLVRDGSNFIEKIILSHANCTDRFDDGGDDKVRKSISKLCHSNSILSYSKILMNRDNGISTMTYTVRRIYIVIEPSMILRNMSVLRIDSKNKLILSQSYDKNIIAIHKMNDEDTCTAKSAHIKGINKTIRNGDLISVKVITARYVPDSSAIGISCTCI